MERLNTGYHNIEGSNGVETIHIQKCLRLVWKLVGKALHNIFLKVWFTIEYFVSLAHVPGMQSQSFYRGQPLNQAAAPDFKTLKPK